MDRIAQLLERLGALQRSELRRYAQEQGLQMVHLEVLAYLLSANRYSDTTQALSEYLGQTKGSISQTVSFLEEQEYLKRSQDEKDRRVFHLRPLPKGRRLVQDFDSLFYGNLKLDKVSEKSIEHSLREIQKKNGLKSFGLCFSCRHNSNPTGQKFVCGLTGENLSLSETRLRCREHEEVHIG